MGLQKVRHDLVTKHASIRIRVLNNHKMVIKLRKVHIDTILSSAVCILVLSIDPTYPLQYFFLLQHRIWSRVRYCI